MKERIRQKCVNYKHTIRGCLNRKKCNPKICKLWEQMRRIPVGDFKFSGEERAAILSVLSGNRISEGNETKRFEELFANYIGTSYCVATNSGTSALIAGLEALKISSHPMEQRVITTPLTYVATSNAIIHSGFEPVFVDIEPETFCIDPEGIATYLEEYSEFCSTILPVHLMGYPCDMDKINSLAVIYGQYVFEDSSQAHGTKYRNKIVGSFGDISAFSFYMAHSLQAGEMGAITTSDSTFSGLIRKIKANGRICSCPICHRSTGKCPYRNREFDPRFTHDFIGYNFKTTEFQAAIATEQLKRIDEILQIRQDNVRYLNDNLSSVSDILQLPVFSKDISYLTYPLVINNKNIKRHKLTIQLEKLGIETRPMFGCIPTQQPAYEHLKHRYEGKLPNAEFVGANGFYIGCHQYLNECDLDYIVKSIKKVLK